MQAAPAQLTANQAAFLRDNPNFVQNQELAFKAIMAAHGESHEPDSAEFHRAVRANFDRLSAPASFFDCCQQFSDLARSSGRRMGHPSKSYRRRPALSSRWGSAVDGVETPLIWHETPQSWSELMARISGNPPTTI
jgi:hypothetical protein